MISGDYIVSYLDGDKLIGVEIGVWWGASLFSDLNQPRIRKMYAIDPFKEYPCHEIVYKQDRWEECYESVRSRLLRHGERVTLIRAKSDDAVHLIPNGVDFVFIDGDHRYGQVTRDIKNYEPKVRKGGIVCGHDYNAKSFTGVTKAVDDYAREHKRIFHPRAIDVYGWWCWEVK